MSSSWKLLRYARTERRSLTGLVLLMVAATLLGTLGPWPMKLIVDHVLMGEPLSDSLAWVQTLPGANSREGLLRWLAASTVALYLAQRVLGAVQGYAQAGIGTRMVYRLGADLFDHLQRLSLGIHAKQRTGDLVHRVTTDSGCVRDLVIGVLFPLLSSTITLVTMFLVMWQLDRSLALLALLAAIPLPVITKFLTPQITERSYRESQLQGELMAHAEQTMSALPIVQAFNREAHHDETFRNLSAAILRAKMRALSAQFKFGLAVGSPTAVGAAAMLGLGGLHVLQGSLTVGSLLVFLAYLDALYGPIETFAYLSAGSASASAASRRVFEILDEEIGVRDAPGAVPLPASPAGGRGHVRFENVTFGYEYERPVLRDVTIEAWPGEKVALVGPTGAGKSTLVSLVFRSFDPWTGRVVVDGLDVRNVQLASLRVNIAVVLQDPFLLPLSVAENIAYGRPDATRDEIVEAAKGANADEFVRRLPNGYDTVVAERGTTLSGGERQRISIARALLKNAPILILDEPTSALDAGTEALLLEALDRLMAGRTTFIIAHRLSTIRNADRIVVIEHGQVTEAGTHAELIVKKKSYGRYYALQNRASDNSEAAKSQSSRGRGD